MREKRTEFSHLYLYPPTFLFKTISHTKTPTTTTHPLPVFLPSSVRSKEE